MQKVDWSSVAAWSLTGAYLLIIGAHMILKPIDLVAMDANLLGDFLAGIAAPLAFGWLIYGYALQRTQLAMQRDQLKMQGDQLVLHLEELKLQRHEQHESTLANQEQASQQRNLALETRRSNELREAQVAIASAPLIAMHFAGYSGPEANVKAINHGATVRKVVVEIGVQNLISGKSLKWEFWKSEDTLHFAIQTRDHSSQEQIPVVIHYETLSGAKHSEYFAYLNEKLFRVTR